MRFQTVAGALALAGTSSAFSDSSPLVLLSSASLKDVPAAKQIQTKGNAMDYVHSILSSCPTNRYLFVNQAGIHSAHLQPSNCLLPSLCRAIDNHSRESKYIVPEVVGDMDISEAQKLLDYTMEACGKANKDAAGADILDMSIPSSDRAAALLDNDALFQERLDTLNGDNDYTVVFLSTQMEDTMYEADFEDAVDMDLKRHVQSGSRVRRADNETDWNKLPLFEKYQFFTPGIFMGLITAIVLFSILGVGLKALSSLEVSYGAFEKDMGPAAQKKQQ